MKVFAPAPKRKLHEVQIDAEVVVVGGGLAGVCAAIAAARSNCSVVLVQDRPVLGGNASSEIRMWAVGATSHMGNNNRWAREGGVVDEILVENLNRNPEGNSLIFDTVLLEKVKQESNIELLLNTAVFEVEKNHADSIHSVRGFCSQNSTMYSIVGKVFVDASGDGIVGFQSGAAFRMGAENKDEFGEGFAPSKEYGELLGHTIYFYSKDAGRAVKFVPPSFALDDITKIPRWRNFKLGVEGCQLWWIEYGGRFDTIHDTEKIKWELWSIVYGVWNHIKNSGEFPEAENMMLEWVGTIPGKRESRRFEGDYILSQQDIVQQRQHEDAISYGGWAIDLHPADGVYSDSPGCNQWHSKGIYQIPYRCLYSRNVDNLFLTGRVISATHVAFGSTRVMLTCGLNGQVVGAAAAMCALQGDRPRDLLAPQKMSQLRLTLDRMGHFTPGVAVDDLADIASEAEITASSALSLNSIPAGDDFLTLDCPVGMLIPVEPGAVPKIGVWFRAKRTTTIDFQVRASSRPGSYTPDQILATKSVEHVIDDSKVEEAAEFTAANDGIATQTSSVIKQGALSFVEVDFDVQVDRAQYLTVCLLSNENVDVAVSDTRITGLLSVNKKVNRRVSTDSSQNPPADIGVDSFEFWIPARRPEGRNLAMSFEPPLEGFSCQHVADGPERPFESANAWVAGLDDDEPYLDFKWDRERRIKRVEIALDTDFDHPMETVLMRHPEMEVPYCVPELRLFDSAMNMIGQVEENFRTRPTFEFEAFSTNSLRLQFSKRFKNIPVSVFRVRIYED